MYEYIIARCKGEDNVAKAIQDRIDLGEGWRVHSIVCTNVEEHEVTLPSLAVQAPAVISISWFLILFELETHSGLPPIKLLKKP